MNGIVRNSLGLPSSSWARRSHGITIDFQTTEISSLRRNICFGRWLVWHYSPKLSFPKLQNKSKYPGISQLQGGSPKSDNISKNLDWVIRACHLPAKRGLFFLTTPSWNTPISHHKLEVSYPKSNKCKLWQCCQYWLGVHCSLLLLFIMLSSKAWFGNATQQ